MNINRVKGVYFSPSGGTFAVVRQMAERLAERLGVPCEMVSYTLPREREEWKDFCDDELIVWGSPVYAGRIPNKTLEFVSSHIHGQGNIAVSVAVYGGRHYDNAVSEMCQVLKEGNMVPVAAAAVVARHAFSHILEEGRPNQHDMNEITNFCNRIRLEPHGNLDVPGTGIESTYYVPQTEERRPAKFLKALPIVDATKCVGCGVCAERCPMGSITMVEGRPVAVGVCIKCQACVRLCKSRAMSFEDGDLMSHIRMLEQNFSQPSANYFWE